MTARTKRQPSSESHDIVGSPGVIFQEYEGTGAENWVGDGQTRYMVQVGPTVPAVPYLGAEGTWKQPGGDLTLEPWSPEP